MKKPVLKVRKYEHSSTDPFLLDLRAYGKGRLFFKTRAAADAEAMRQRTLLERHSREAIGLSQRELNRGLMRSPQSSCRPQEMRLSP
jgi:hypothetical protein